VTEPDSLAERFEEHRVHLRAVAYRMLGSAGGAEDAVQEAWLRLSRSDTGGIENLRGWLTTAVARLCLDALRSRASRREAPLESDEAAGVEAAFRSTSNDPERDLLMSDSVGTALLKVLDTLEPAERVAFVLHDTFDIAFDEIATIVGRTPEAARKLASRARHRMQGADDAPQVDQARKREVIGAFLAASREGDFAALLALLDPAAILRADLFAVRMGAAAQVTGQAAVAETFRGRAKVAQLALLDGAVGAVWQAGGQTRVAFAFTLVDGHIAAIDLIADPETLQKLDITLLS
jgi:RNA polymerase sigma-70 factor, ECF subfamily